MFVLVLVRRIQAWAMEFFQRQRTVAHSNRVRRRSRPPVRRSVRMVIEGSPEGSVRQWCDMHACDSTSLLAHI